jgi:hypothetical protein
MPENLGIRPHIDPSKPAPGFEDLESRPHDLLEDKSEVLRQVRREGATSYTQARSERKKAAK